MKKFLPDRILFRSPKGSSRILTARFYIGGDPPLAWLTPWWSAPPSRWSIFPKGMELLRTCLSLRIWNTEDIWLKEMIHCPALLRDLLALGHHSSRCHCQSGKAKPVAGFLDQLPELTPDLDNWTEVSSVGITRSTSYLSSNDEVLDIRSLPLFDVILGLVTSWFFLNQWVWTLSTRPRTRLCLLLHRSRTWPLSTWSRRDLTWVSPRSWNVTLPLRLPSLILLEELSSLHPKISTTPSENKLLSLSRTSTMDSRISSSFGTPFPSISWIANNTAWLRN